MGNYPRLRPDFTEYGHPGDMDIFVTRDFSAQEVQIITKLANRKPAKKSDPPKYLVEPTCTKIG